MIRFTPYAFQKVTFFTKKDVEVGGFAVTDEKDSSLIVDFKVLKQESTAVTFSFDKSGMEEYLNTMIDAGYSPANCFRMYIHTHPGNSADPSHTDWTQFSDLMASYPWFAMIIFAKDLSTYAYVKQTQGIGLEAEVEVAVDWNQPCKKIDFDELEAEFNLLVTKPAPVVYQHHFKLPSAFDKPIKSSNWWDHPLTKKSKDWEPEENFVSLHSMSEDQFAQFEKELD